MSITSFVKEHAAVTPNADIVERWESRIVPNGLQNRGAEGADFYLGNWGKGLKAPKAIAFARIAEIKGATEMAARFWEEAYFLATGSRERLAAGAQACDEGETATVATPTLKSSFNQQPQVPVAVDRATAMMYAADPAWGVQEKKNGRRLMIRVRGKVVTGGNKKGLAGVVPLPVADLLASRSDAEPDGEDVPGAYYAFDLLSVGTTDLRQCRFEERYAALVKHLAGVSDAVRVVPLITEHDAKLAFIKSLEAENAEGFILKRLDAPYIPGEKAGTQFKFQFRAINAFIVGPQNGLKRSVQISVMRADGSIRGVGSVTIPANAEIPTEGSIAEIQYLYVENGLDGCLHQPVFLEGRDDAAPDDCQEKKLKPKGAND